MKGITDFRCGINRLSEIIRDKQTVNVFDNVAFIFNVTKLEEYVAPVKVVGTVTATVDGTVQTETVEGA